MEVLKTTSPVVLPFAPTETPRNTVPSSRASTAGVDTPVPRPLLYVLSVDARSGRALCVREQPPASCVSSGKFPGANINEAGDGCPCLKLTDAGHLAWNMYQGVARPAIRRHAARRARTHRGPSRGA